MITIESILNYCTDILDGVVLNKNWGEKAIFYNPQGTLSKGVYILTIKEKDGLNDKSSNINRENVFRVNIGIKKETFIKMFSYIPTRPPAGGIVQMDYDFTKLDTIMPHPVYAWMCWICVLSPSSETFEKLKPFIKESYIYAQEKFRKRK
ncbi:DUF6194 family protein [Desulfovibrio litoralis]|uniref:DUF6194 domain-containing protein n=1 Tax=Desulfovibrio litoralis DSM 11393 TaxID=1121455 RepID=A0A1M7TD92_9BACT|nr:DUF6194 family protein [Desulfovibrio litoralis]SHN68744.1 hypothetical protein SAMN02745728_01883 [Desulfovibrio litoralis DSM 11393]